MAIFVNILLDSDIDLGIKFSVAQLGNTNYVSQHHYLSTILT
jgi:hypothetical protein